MREKESKLNLPYSENFVLVEFNESQEEKKWTKLSCHELYSTRLEKNSVDTKWNWENSKEKSPWIYFALAFFPHSLDVRWFHHTCAFAMFASSSTNFSVNLPVIQSHYHILWTFTQWVRVFGARRMCSPHMVIFVEKVVALSVIETFWILAASQNFTTFR